MKFMQLAVLALALLAAANGDATSDIKAVAKSCKNFFDLCAAGCKTGWGARCGGGSRRWAASTRCSCSDWAGLRPPKKEQTDKEFHKQLLDTHNMYRARHHAPPLEWDSHLQAFAQQYIDKLAAENGFSHNPEIKALGYGENLAWASGGIVEGKDPVEGWYDEVTNVPYDFSKPGFQKGAGHFTQVVWKGSTKLGCARAKVPGTDSTLTGCNYSPAGNVNTAEKFRANVIQA